MNHTLRGALRHTVTSLQLDASHSSRRLDELGISRSACGPDFKLRQAASIKSHRGKPSALLPPRAMGSLCGSKPLPEEVQRRSG